MGPWHTNLNSLLDPLFYSSREDIKEELMWINITHVCAHWRHVALHYPALWTAPPFRFPKLAAFMLQRSQNAPLNALVNTSDMSPESTSALLRHVSRLETLVVHQSEETELSILQKIFDGVTLAHAPVLRRLRIHRVWSPFISDADVILPKTSSIGAVRLRELYLTFVDVDWDCHLLSSLTSLSLLNISAARKPTAAQFRFMMERKPDLQELRLENAFPSSQGPVGTSKFAAERILLAHLKTVTLELTLPQLKFFSATVAFPSSIQNISLSLVHTGGYALGSLLSDMLYQYPWSRNCSVVVEVGCTHGGLCVRFIISPTLASERESLSSPTQGNENDDLRIELGTRRFDSTATLVNYDSDREWDPTDRTMEQLFKNVRWSHLAELVCSGGIHNFMSEAVTWATTFGTLHGLHTVIVDVDLADRLISAFQIGLLTHESPRDKPKFPGLHHFEIRDYGQTISTGVDVAKLRECLLIRKGHGLELTSLKLINCIGSWVKDVEELKELVTIIEYLERGHTNKKKKNSLYIDPIVQAIRIP